VYLLHNPNCERGFAGGYEFFSSLALRVMVSRH